MKIALITANGRENEIGLRTIAACLRGHGHDVFVLYPLARENHGLGRLTQADAELLLPWCADADLVGVSYMSNFRKNAQVVAETLRKHLRPDAALVAGGIHPTLWPEDALAHFQYVIRGEGEESMVELAQRIAAGESVRAIENLAYLDEGKPVLNPLRPLLQNLDALPIPLLEYGRIVFRRSATELAPLDPENVREFFWQAETPTDGEVAYFYGIHTSRGCPHKCAFCVNDALSRLYPQKKGSATIRRQSVEKLVSELEWMRRTFPFVQNVLFTDDVFTARPIEELKRFSEIYRRRVGLRFNCYLSAPTLTEEKMDALMAAGLQTVSLGIQSGSDRVNLEVFSRPIPRRQNDKAIGIIAPHISRLDKKIPVKVHFIIKNPWENRRDVLQTVRMICGLPRGVSIILFSLNFFPGTKMLERALKEGIVRDFESDIENRDGWSDKRLIFDARTGRPSAAAILPLYAVQYLRSLPKWQRGLAIFILGNPITYWLLGTWRFSSRIRRAVEIWAGSRNA